MHEQYTGDLVAGPHDRQRRPSRPTLKSAILSHLSTKKPVVRDIDRSVSCEMPELEPTTSSASDSEVQHIETVAHPVAVSIGDVIPQDFSSRYEPGIRGLHKDGHRPFALASTILPDWSLNDLRALLIVYELKPEWNGTVPQLTGSELKVQYIPLTVTDEEFTEALTSSELYKECNFSQELRLSMAKHAVESIGRHDHTTPLTVPQWFYAIENYLLNLACEAQSRIDYQAAINRLLRERRAPIAAFRRDRSSTCTTSQGPPISGNPAPISGPADESSGDYLLKKVLTNRALRVHRKSSGDLEAARLISDEEKATIWNNIQAALHKRLELLWKKDSDSQITSL
ncbi:hypothetical protein CANCADRAFT_44153 [Tortispora caseinolytica NRRL Y-17796]|uniref:Uncharacterized protein n=1 Tax=Tortispora caseinolytica NRRL Y-17796 TaxID=767744 RepID=A0A1E4TFM6_9ASCO|nr:hypothetical protein CANCADRAFT_44153 [Tortispora caseinolytica NRRL Y-17796]